ncbi:MAG: glycerol-3-phosphate 1-O-acyltransferase PlsY [Bryobacterales bacterium]|jgi:glycerol-3-phosphate acyltransferase PlsY|nr:glycerol-3-phosphate 1-O-acyltransferase PlsY [Bryobacterales bacterium]
MTLAIAILVAYVLGSIPFGLVLVRWRTGLDVRSKGSGNIGATNVARTAGRGLGILTLALDVGKGAAAVWMADLLSAGDPVTMAAATFAVLCGHMFPVWLKFQGGKAVASALGAFLVLTPWAMLATMLVFAPLIWKTRIVSLSSIVAAAILPLGVWLLTHNVLYLVVAAASAALIIYKHKGNIARLRAGTENRLGSRA